MLNKNIVFIGGGNMAASLVGGLLQQGYEVNCISVSDPDLAKQEAFKALGVHTFSDNLQAVEGADVIVLAIKPNQMQAVAEQIAMEVVKNKALIISVAAGIRSVALGRWLNGDISIVRAMPNTPALINYGATGLYATPNVSESQRQLATQILQAVGITVWVEQEQQIDVVTALSGSGPAYFFLFIELLEKQATELGLAPEISHKLAVQTALGAAHMAESSQYSVEELRHQVTSPGGTTEQAIQAFMGRGFEALVGRALQAAHQRSISLGEQLGSEN